MTNEVRDALLRALYPDTPLHISREIRREQMRGFERRLRDGGYVIEPAPE